FDRILTSGGQESVLDALPLMAQLIERARDRITILPGGGITAENAGTVWKTLPIEELHAACSRPVPQLPAAVAFGFTAEIRHQTDAEAVRATRAAMAAAR